MSEQNVIQRLRRLGYAVRRSPSGEARAGRGARARRPLTRSKLLPEAEQGAEAAVFSCGWSLVADTGYDFDGELRGPEPWVLVQYTLSGNGRLRRDGHEQVLSPGSLLVLPMPDRHRYWLPRGSAWEFAYASLRGAAPRRAAARFLAAHGPNHSLPAEAPAAQGLLALVVDLLGGEALSPHAVSERGYALAMRLLECADQIVPGATLPPPFADLTAWCLPRLRGLRVEDLARHAGRSREHFTRTFLSACGCPPGRFLADLRQSVAIAAIRSGAQPKAIAKSAGLADARALRRALRRRLGWSP